MRLEPITETNNHINYLDTLITRNPKKLGTIIFRKPTSTNTTLNCYSKHPLEHKIAAYKFHIDSMFTLPLGEEERQVEWESIKQKARNKHRINLLQKLKKRNSGRFPIRHSPSKNSDMYKLIHKWHGSILITPHTHCHYLT